MKEEKDNLGFILKKTLSGIPAPELRPDFVTSVVKRIRNEQKATVNSKWKTLIQMAVYWTIVLILSLGLLYGAQVNKNYLLIIFLATPLLFLGQVLSIRFLKLLNLI